MDKATILEAIRQNAQDACQPSPKLYLLSIDLDNYYLRYNARNEIKKLAQEVDGFLGIARQFFNVVHVWHDSPNLDIDRLQLNLRTPKQRRGSLIVADEKDYSFMFPYTPPVAGEAILSKEFDSAFFATELENFMPKQDSIVLALGTSRKICITSSLIGGINCGYNMAAVTDLIYPPIPTETCTEPSELGGAPVITSHEILEALCIDNELN